MTDFAAYVIIFELTGILICVFNIVRMMDRDRRSY